MNPGDAEPIFIKNEYCKHQCSQHPELQIVITQNDDEASPHVVRIRWIHISIRIRIHVLVLHAICTQSCIHSILITVRLFADSHIVWRQHGNSSFSLHMKNQRTPGFNHIANKPLTAGSKTLLSYYIVLLTTHIILWTIVNTPSRLRLILKMWAPLPLCTTCASIQLHSQHTYGSCWGWSTVLQPSANILQGISLANDCFLTLCVGRLIRFSHAIAKTCEDSEACITLSLTLS